VTTTLLSAIKNGELKELVTTVAPALQAHMLAAMKMLREVKTAEFDQAFLKHEASYHAEVIQLVTETLLPAIVNAELKALVVKVSPVFEAHRAGADALSKRLAK
jgi:putative membrane protein